MPRIEAEPGTNLREVWIYLSEEEADDLRLALTYRIEEEVPRRPGWHTHILDQRGREVTIAVGEPEPPA